MLRSLFRISWSNLWSNKVRTFLTMLGIIIGISSIIALITIGEGVTYAVVDQLSGLGSNPASATITNTKVKPGFTKSELERFASLPHVEGISPSLRSNRVVTLLPSQTTSIYEEAFQQSRRIMGVNDYYFSSNVKSGMLFGRSITATDAEYATNVCVLGYTTWERLYGNYNPVGETIKIANIDFTIVGVMDSLLGMDTTGNYSVLVPYTVAIETLGMGLPKSVDIIVSDAAYMDDVLESVDRLCASLLNDATGRDYTVVNQQQMMNMVVTVTDLVLGMLGGIAAIALLVGGIGIMNMMLVTVSERTTEIGLRKALGAKPLTILAQFLMESVIISLLGGILGVLLGIGLSALASVLIGYEFAMKTTTILAATGFSFAVGVLFGILPARKAARMNPIDALRTA